MRRSLSVILCTLIGILVISVLFQKIDGGPDAVRYLQHQEPLPSVAPSSENSTHLPIIKIETGGQEIPGIPIDDKNHIYTKAKDGSDFIRVAISTIEQAGSWHTAQDTAAFTGNAAFRVRGNSSRNFDKKQYLLHIVNRNGKDANAPLLGMNSASKWVLNGPFLDRTLIRNYLCYSVAGQVMEYAPDLRFCQLYLDGEYQGLYLLTEAVTKGDGRIELTSSGPKSVVTSWIVRWDRDGKGDVQLNDFSYYTNRAGVSGLELRYPGKETLTPERLGYVASEINEFERTLYSTEFKDPAKGYRAFLDPTSFAEYLILNEFFSNVDAGRFSTYYYKDVRGKIKPVVWDFNNACDNYIDYNYTDSGFTTLESQWFDQLIKDEYFVDIVIDRYYQLRRGVLSDEYLIDFIDDTVAYLGQEIEHNYDVWGYVFTATKSDSLNYLNPYERNYKSYDESVEQLKSWLTARGRWLDENIESLRQYCHPSKNAAQTLG